MSALMMYFKLIVDVFEALYKRFPVLLYDCITNPIQHKSRKDGLSRVEEASVATTGFPRYSSGTIIVLMTCCCRQCYSVSISSVDSNRGRQAQLFCSHFKVIVQFILLLNGWAFT
ncbi:hypothetical protein HanPI659440_Chr11g0431541 [Helianthus annuus]|nr:hypothetical protein HanPI659440_Chr11g0431541 [Helianthus annuus]